MASTTTLSQSEKDGASAWVEQHLLRHLLYVQFTAFRLHDTEHWETSVREALAKARLARLEQPTPTAASPWTSQGEVQQKLRNWHEGKMTAIARKASDLAPSIRWPLRWEKMESAANCRQDDIRSIRKRNIDIILEKLHDPLGIIQQTTFHTVRLATMASLKPMCEAQYIIWYSIAAKLAHLYNIILPEAAILEEFNPRAAQPPEAPGAPVSIPSSTLQTYQEPEGVVTEKHLLVSPSRQLPGSLFSSHPDVARTRQQLTPSSSRRKIAPQPHRSDPFRTPPRLRREVKPVLSLPLSPCSIHTAPIKIDSPLDNDQRVWLTDQRDAHNAYQTMPDHQARLLLIDYGVGEFVKRHCELDAPTIPYMRLWRVGELIDLEGSNPRPANSYPYAVIKHGCRVPVSHQGPLIQLASSNNVPPALVTNASNPGCGLVSTLKTHPSHIPGLTVGADGDEDCLDPAVAKLELMDPDMAARIRGVTSSISHHGEFSTTNWQGANFGAMALIQILETTLKRGPQSESKTTTSQNVTFVLITVSKPRLEINKDSDNGAVDKSDVYALRIGEVFVVPPGCAYKVTSIIACAIQYRLVHLTTRIHQISHCWAAQKERSTERMKVRKKDELSLITQLCEGQPLYPRDVLGRILNTN